MLLREIVMEDEASRIFTALGGAQKYILVRKTEGRRTLSRSRHLLGNVERTLLKT
jgi:hypothetical protein